MKSQKELEELKQEVETVNRKLHELTDEELAQVSGGVVGAYGGYSSVLGPIICPGCDQYTATYFYRNKKCVKITCPCGYVREDENGIKLL